MNYELVLGMKVKSCINPQRWGATIDLDFPRIYVWDCNDIKGLNVTLYISFKPDIIASSDVNLTKITS